MKFLVKESVSNEDEEENPARTIDPIDILNEEEIALDRIKRAPLNKIIEEYHLNKVSEAHAINK